MLGVGALRELKGVAIIDGKDRSKQPIGQGWLHKYRFQLGNMKYRKYIVPFLKEQKTHLFAGFLIVVILILLFGIFSQLQSPAMNNVPSGETGISYSSFVDQVNAGNMLAVSFQGNGVSALLEQPLTSQATPSRQPLTHEPLAQKSAEIAAWTHDANSSDANWDASATTLNIAADRQIYTVLPASGSSELIALLMRKHVAVNTQAPATTPSWLGIVLKFAPLFFLLGLLAMVLKPRKRVRLPEHMHEQMIQFTKQRSRRADKSGVNQSKQVAKAGTNQSKQATTGQRNVFKPTGAASAHPLTDLAPPTTFADVAGIDEVRVELEEIVQFLRSPEKFNSLGAHIPSGALLVGPPGTGKTLLARAVAGEAGVPFFSVSASEFVEMFVGVGASRVRDLFSQARQVAPAVIFIDEIDAVGRKRAMKATGSEERDQTLNQLLVEMDGFHASQAIVVMAATNRVDILDKALLRPGRFDRHISVSLPDRVGRQAILSIHSAKMPLHEAVSLERLARLTTGMSGADLANLVNEAALCAARQDLRYVDTACFEDALARVQLGALRPLVMSEAERRIIAYHEGGHALVAYYLAEADTVNRVTILPRGQSLGVTQFIAEEDRYNYSREMLMAKIAVGLGGRVAEELILGRARVTTGAENDFQVVTGMARRMVTHWGMSDEFGVVFAGANEARASLNMSRLDLAAPPFSQTLALDANGYLVPNGQPKLVHQSAFALAAPATNNGSSPNLTSLVDREMKKILDEGHEMARNILHTHLNQLQRLAEVLMEREQLSRTEFEALMQEGCEQL